MEVIPLFSDTHAGGEYLTLGAALAHKRIVITEVSRAGEVPELKVVNRGKIPVLLIDGEELAGAKQNRVLNTTILVAGGSEIVIPVSCTEHGRWEFTTPYFEDSQVMMDYRIRGKKMASVAMSMKYHKTRHSDQLEIWDDIREVAQKAKVESQTGAMRDIFTSYDRSMEEYVKAFPLQPGQQGVLVYIDGCPAGMVFLSRADAYAKIHDKLIRSYVLEVLIDEKVPAGQPQETESPEQFIERIKNAVDEAFPGVGLGTEHRLEGADLVGSALVHDGVVIHLACFSGVPSLPSQEEEFMAGYRRRRRSHTARNREFFAGGPVPREDGR
jgi:hypothetical protein